MNAKLIQCKRKKNARANYSRKRLFCVQEENTEFLTEEKKKKKKKKRRERKERYT